MREVSKDIVISFYISAKMYWSLFLSRYSVRTSSAKWDADKITLVEKRNYRCQMGFEGLGL